MNTRSSTYSVVVFLGVESDCTRLDCSTPQSSCYILKSWPVTFLVDMSTHEIFRCRLTFSLSPATPAVSLCTRSTLSLSRCLLPRSNLRLAVRSTIDFRLCDVRGDNCPYLCRHRPPLVSETKQVISGRTTSSLSSRHTNCNNQGEDSGCRSDVITIRAQCAISLGHVLTKRARSGATDQFLPSVCSHYARTVGYSSSNPLSRRQQWRAR